MQLIQDDYCYSLNRVMKLVMKHCITVFGSTTMTNIVLSPTDASVKVIFHTISIINLKLLVVIECLLQCYSSPAAQSAIT
jgi:hypothetical protein